MSSNTNIKSTKVPWNKDKFVGQKLPLKLKEIWAIRIRLQLAKRTRELAMFNLAIDSKLRAIVVHQEQILAPHRVGYPQAL